MKTKTLFTLVFFLAGSAMAATLNISGTVVDTGFRMNQHNKLVPIINTSMKIYVKGKALGLKWQELNGPLVLSDASHIRVVAP